MLTIRKRLLRRLFQRFKIQAVTRFFGVVGSQTVLVLPHPGKKFKVWLVDTELGYETGAAVAILETHAKDIPNPVRGLVRIVQVSSKLTILDLTIQGLSPGRYHATIRASGDISRGAASTGDVWERQKSEKEEADAPPSGEFGPIDVGKSGAASVLLDKPIEVWEIIGRSFVVSKERDGSFKPDGPDTVVGVIARSAGVWENEKTVCWISSLAYLADLPSLPPYPPPGLRPLTPTASTYFRNKTLPEIPNVSNALFGF